MDIDSIENIARIIMNCRGTVWTCGNGGSATTAMHFAQDLVRACKIRSISISDPGYLTATANDDGYENVFSQYMDLFWKGGDILIIFSGSGSSPNVVKVAETMRGKITTIAFTGFGGGKLLDLCDYNLYLNNYDMREVESAQLDLAHTIVDTIIKYEKSI